MTKKKKDQAQEASDEMVDIQTIIAERDSLLKEKAELEDALEKKNAYAKGLLTQINNLKKDVSKSVKANKNHTFHKAE